MRYPCSAPQWTMAGGEGVNGQLYDARRGADKSRCGE